MPDGDFTICRLEYTRVVIEDMGVGWQTDYPFSERNLMTRLSELTKTPISRDQHDEPNTWVVKATDPQLFNCPYVVASDAGTIGFKSAEVQGLREYLLKGGFLWVDDFWGSLAWRNWENQIGKALSPAEYPIIDLTVDHTMFRMLFPVQTLPQIPNVGLWRMERRTSERGADSDELHVRGIQDRHGRVMVLMTHNTDFGDAYERESDDPSYFEHFSVNGYAIGIDVLLYAMTH